ncbi:MAG TPA: hypothetical protein VHB79_00615 [Polyangiaceae bacterium]|nr:hypothetical protein [Polyangiaceae bacterium]
MNVLKGASWFVVLASLWLGSQGCMFVHDTDCQTDSDCSSGRVCSSGTCQGPGGDRGESQGLDWYSSSCAALGGTTTTAGACFVSCTTNADCPLDSLECFGGGTWVGRFCRVKSEGGGCGPRGWKSDPWGCYLACSGVGRNSECPAGWSCVQDSGTTGYFCTGQPSSSSSGGDACSRCSSACAGISGCSCCKECNVPCFD